MNYFIFFALVLLGQRLLPLKNPFAMQFRNTHRHFCTREQSFAFFFANYPPIARLSCSPLNCLSFAQVALFYKNYNFPHTPAWFLPSSCSLVSNNGYFLATRWNFKQNFNTRKFFFNNNLFANSTSINAKMHVSSNAFSQHVSPFLHSYWLLTTTTTTTTFY